jgi:curved DNA-binding protein CbpA
VARRPARSTGPAPLLRTLSAISNPYDILGVRPGVSDEELRATYRRLVQLHHPDHNNGSKESARRFEEVQEAYAAIQKERRRTPPRRATPPPPPSSPDVEQRLADMERELREKAKAARERAQRAARAAAAAATSSKKTDRPSDEELGYVKTDDTLGKIVADGLDEFAEWIERRRPKGPKEPKSK